MSSGINLAILFLTVFLVLSTVSFPLSSPPPPLSAASPYTDDASFASFVAGEAHDSGSAMDEDHFSPSPSPPPSMTQVSHHGNL